MKIVVYSHLQGGGANKVWCAIVNELKKSNELIDFTDTTTYLFSSFLHYLLYVYFKLPIDQRRLANLINNYKPDIILISHHYLTKSPYLLRYCQNTVYLCHEEPREFYEDSTYLINGISRSLVNLFRLPLKSIDKNNVANAKILIANSNYSKKKLINIYHRDFYKITMPLILDSYEDCVAKKYQYLSIGSTSKFKGVEFIIESISKLPNKYKYPIVIVGDKGRDHDRLIKMAIENDVKIIHYRNVSKDKLIELYKSSSLLLAAAHNEPFGLSLIEALSYGLPVLSVNEGGYAEIIDSKVQQLNYGLVIKRDSNSFANGIIEMLNKKRSKEIEITKYIKNKYCIDKTIKELNYIFNLL